MSLCDLTLHDSAILSVTASAGSVIGWLLRIVYVEERLGGADTVAEPSCVRVIHEVREEIVGLAFGSPFVTGCWQLGGVGAAHVQPSRSLHL